MSKKPIIFGGWEDCHIYEEECIHKGRSGRSSYAKYLYTISQNHRHHRNTPSFLLHVCASYLLNAEKFEWKSQIDKWPQVLAAGVQHDTNKTGSTMLQLLVTTDIVSNIHFIMWDIFRLNGNLIHPEKVNPFTTLPRKTWDLEYAWDSL